MFSLIYLRFRVIHCVRVGGPQVHPVQRSGKWAPPTRTRQLRERLLNLGVCRTMTTTVVIRVRVDIWPVRLFGINLNDGDQWQA